MSTLVLPDPTLVVLVGAAGSGKSTLAARLFAPDEVVSSDALRAAISGNEADQRATAAAFRALHRTVDRRLAAGAMTVVDATNAKARAPPTTPPTERARPAHPWWRSSSTCRRRPSTPRTPPDPPAWSTPPSSTATWQRSANDIDHGRLTTEGFDHIVMLRSSTEVDDLRIDRRTPVNQPT